MYTTLFMKNWTSIIVLYMVIILVTVLTSLLPLVMSTTIETLPHPPLLLLGFILAKFIFTDLMQYVTDKVRTTVRTSLWIDIVERELSKGTSASGINAKLKYGNSMVDVLVCDIPSILDVVIGLGVVLITAFATGIVVGGYMLGAIVICIIATVVKSSRSFKLHQQLFHLEAVEVDLLNDRKLDDILTWKNTKVSITNKFWVIDLSQGLIQSPVIICALGLALSHVPNTAANLTLLLGLFLALFGNVNQFAQLQENVGRALTASHNLA